MLVLMQGAVKFIMSCSLSPLTDLYCLLGSGRTGFLRCVWWSWRCGCCHLCCQSPPRQLSSSGILQPGPQWGALQSLQTHWWTLCEEGLTRGNHICKEPNSLFLLTNTVLTSVNLWMMQSGNLSCYLNWICLLTYTNTTSTTIITATTTTSTAIVLLPLLYYAPSLEAATHSPTRREQLNIF